MERMLVPMRKKLPQVKAAEGRSGSTGVYGAPGLSPQDAMLNKDMSHFVLRELAILWEGQQRIGDWRRYISLSEKTNHFKDSRNC